MTNKKETLIRLFKAIYIGKEDTINKIIFKANREVNRLDYNMAL